MTSTRVPRWLVLVLTWELLHCSLPNSISAQAGVTKGNNESQWPSSTGQEAKGVVRLLSIFLVFTPSLFQEGLKAAQEVCMTEPHFQLQEITHVKHVTTQVRYTNSHDWKFWGADTFITKKWKKLIVVTQWKQVFNRQKSFSMLGLPRKWNKGTAEPHNIWNLFKNPSKTSQRQCLPRVFYEQWMWREKIFLLIHLS